MNQFYGFDILFESDADRWTMMVDIKAALPRQTLLIVTNFPKVLVLDALSQNCNENLEYEQSRDPAEFWVCRDILTRKQLKCGKPTWISVDHNVVDHAVLNTLIIIDGRHELLFGGEERYTNA